MKKTKTKNKNKMVRQGDILIEKIDHKPETYDASENGRIILAHGEVTGHAHEIDDREQATLGKPAMPIKVDGDTDSETATQSILTLGRNANLVHQEHAGIPLERGTYRVTRQREYSPEAIRNVAD